MHSAGYGRTVAAGRLRPRHGHRICSRPRWSASERKLQCELDSLLGLLPVNPGCKDQATAEGVAATNAVVDDVKSYSLRSTCVLLNSRQHSAPAVVRCAVALTQGDSHLLEVELVSQLLGNALVALSVQLAAVDIGSLGLDAEHVLCVLPSLEMQTWQRTGTDRSRQRGPAPTGPQLAAVVQVAADLHAVSLIAGLAGRSRQRSRPEPG